MNITRVPVHGGLPGYTERPHLQPPEPITLDVSGQRFTTTIPTLTARSEYFQTFFQGNWKSALQPDGTLFIDSDPETFQHILKYLRRGVFPLSYDQSKGHNYELYGHILADAQHFQIPKLERWIDSRLYVNCVTSYTVWSPHYKDDAKRDGPQTTSTWFSDVVDTQLVREQVETKRTAVCMHEAENRLAKLACPKKFCSPGAGFQDESETYRWAEVGKRNIFHHGWSSDTGKDFVKYWETRGERSPAVPEKF
ncbi:hypothetical protein B0T16DRAFT_460825 [Cercophora newfieldiana]|uniref:BTB domain-containing protein n=1 Tax=Cercophora newfieldiana TaxID=92897 RepID=A0AA39XWI0_9PEZI|nr:hypothetical protein B0T16DRAFT_460825 [Cercophora newfieldiana]